MENLGLGACWVGTVQLSLPVFTLSDIDGDSVHTVLPDRNLLGICACVEQAEGGCVSVGPWGLDRKTAAHFINIYHSPAQPVLSDLWPEGFQLCGHLPFYTTSKHCNGTLALGQPLVTD